MLRSLSARVVVSALVVVTVVLVGGGLVIVNLTEQRDNQDADTELHRFELNLMPGIAGTLGIVPPHAGQARSLGGLAIFNRDGTRVPLPLPHVVATRPGQINGGAARALVAAFNQHGAASEPAGQIEFLRAISLDSGRRLVLGTIPHGFPPMRTQGARTLTVAGMPYRDVVLRSPLRIMIEIAAQGRSISARAARLRTIVIWSGLAGLAAALIGTLLLTQLTLRPLTSLTRKAASIKGTDDLEVSVEEPGQPREVARLAQELDRMLARLRDAVAAREAVLLSARRFAADAGHELRTPLQSVRANLDIAKSAGANAEQRQVALDTATLQSERLNRLVDGLQTLARGEAGLVSPVAEVDLGDIADSAVFAAHTRHPELKIETDLPPSGPIIRGDADGLWRAVENLLENAARHGRVPGQVRLQVSATNGGAEVVVEDDGPGIPDGERERVVRPFARGDGVKAGGSGLGLSIVDAEARRHGGALTLSHSQLGGLLARVTLHSYGASD